MIKRICVFCGANAGRQPIYHKAAASIGKLIAKEGIGLVYGGGSVGLMGAVADAALASGGDVIGVIPKSLYEKELAHLGLHRLHVTDSMHERKAMMAELADGFIALPGGFGTFEEFFEIVTWSYLGIHDKPCGLLNVSGYFDSLLEMCDHAVREGFIRLDDRKRIVDAETPEAIIQAVLNYQLPKTLRWMTSKEV